MMSISPEAYYVCVVDGVKAFEIIEICLTLNKAKKELAALRECVPNRHFVIVIIEEVHTVLDL